VPRPAPETAAPPQRDCARRLGTYLNAHPLVLRLDPHRIVTVLVVVVAMLVAGHVLAVCDRCAVGAGAASVL
jgi:hypothetical protein